jgi:hypothetical protein
MIIFAGLFVALVIADTLLTYRIIRTGRGREAAFAKLYIKNPVATVTLTTLGVLLILDLIYESHFYLLFVPLIAIFGWACWHNWKVLHG